METPECAFALHILDAYSFRNMLSICKGEINRASMILSPDLIEISFLNNSRCAIYKIELYPKEHRDWIYNCRGEDGELLSEYPIGFDTKEFFNTTKNIGKNDGIRLFMMTGETKVMVQPLKISAKDPGQIKMLMFNILPIEHCRYETQVYTRDPNIRIVPKSFSDMCTEVVSQQCDTIEITGNGGLLMIKGFHGNKTEKYVTRFGIETHTVVVNKPVINNISEVDNLLKIMKSNEQTDNNTISSGLKLRIKSADTVKIRIPISTIKALSKIHNITAKSNLLRFYFESEQPVLMELIISTLGVFRVFLIGS